LSNIYGSSKFHAQKFGMEETRIAPRRRIFKAGTIESGGGIACHVKNLSETGAQLEVLSPLYIPDRFTLVVPSDQIRRDCQVVWRKQKRLGVAFE
jgi:PilZ domain-containing protein